MTKHSRDAWAYPGRWRSDPRTAPLARARFMRATRASRSISWARIPLGSETIMPAPRNAFFSGGKGSKPPSPSCGSAQGQSSRAIISARSGARPVSFSLSATASSAQAAANIPASSSRAAPIPPSSRRSTPNSRWRAKTACAHGPSRSLENSSYRRASEQLRSSSRSATMAAAISSSMAKPSRAA